MVRERHIVGTCKWYNDVKKYGFLRPDDGGDDVFFHQSAIRADGYRTLHENEPVEFIVSFLERFKYTTFNLTI